MPSEGAEEGLLAYEHQAAVCYSQVKDARKLFSFLTLVIPANLRSINLPSLRLYASVSKMGLNLD